MEGNKIKEFFAKVQESFNDFMNPPAAPAPVQLMDAQLLDGTPIKVTDMAPGGIVTINDMPAPAGELELVDGTKLVIGDNGAITEVIAADATPAPPPVGMSTDERFTQFETQTNEKFTTYEQRFAQYEQKFQEYETKLGKASQLIEGLMGLVTEISKQPTGLPEPALKNENNFIEQTITEKAAKVIF